MSNGPSKELALKRRLTTAVTGTSATMIAGRTYTTDNGSLVTLTLPATAKVGDRIRIINKGAGFFKIAQLASQQIRHLTTDTTAGTGGSLTATAARDEIEIECTTEGVGIWTTVGTKGTFTVV